MKKLMIGFAAAAAMICAADIESSNIVGYQTTASVYGFNFYSPQFKAIGAETISIQNIKLGGVITDWGDNIQVLDEGGATTATYFYASAGESPIGEDGWLNETADGLADTALLPGQSVIVEAQGDGLEITNAGEVSTADAAIEGVQGFNFVGNSSPVAINIQDIKISGAITDWGDNIQILDEGGATIATYFYASAGESPIGEDGWLNETADGLADVVIQPGQGIIVEAQGEGVTITLPAAK